MSLASGTNLTKQCPCFNSVSLIFWVFDAFLGLYIDGGLLALPADVCVEAGGEEVTGMVAGFGPTSKIIKKKKKYFGRC